MHPKGPQPALEAQGSTVYVHLVQPEEVVSRRY